MKAPAFWYRSGSAAACMLAPLGCLYHAGGALRRLFAKPYHASVPVICVGNVTAGGAGKTPTALALAALLQQRGFRPVFVTRGYGGSESGPLRVDLARHSAADVGDEALLLGRQAPVWIGRDRAEALRHAAQEATHIILDDGLQNPHIAPDLSLLVVDGAVGIGNGRLIPAGPLREPLADALQRVAAVLVIGDADPQVLAHFAGHTILRAHLRAEIPEDLVRDAKYLAFAGIGRPEKFYALCRKERLTLVATQDFADHHVFTPSEFDALERKAASLGAKLLTTEKDFVRLPPEFRTRVATFPVHLQFDNVGAVEKLAYSLTTAPSLPS